MPVGVKFVELILKPAREGFEGQKYPGSGVSATGIKMGKQQKNGLIKTSPPGKRNVSALPFPAFEYMYGR
jgi:hypothetical protein